MKKSAFDGFHIEVVNHSAVKSSLTFFKSWFQHVYQLELTQQGLANALKGKMRENAFLEQKTDGSHSKKKSQGKAFGYADMEMLTDKSN